jgi:hypothetical protein
LSVPLYMDHHVHAAITAGLRQRGVDCLTAREDGTDTWADDLLLQRATDLNRVMFSQDEDMLSITAQWLVSGRPFAGLVYGEQLRLTIGQAISDLELVAKTSVGADMLNHIEYLPI